MPRLPQIRLSYGTELTQEYRRKKISMGDGYSVRAQDGLNAAPQRWKLIWENIPNADAEMLRQFFKELGGVDLIRWQPIDQPEALLWTAGGFSSQPSTFGKRNCSVTLEQEFDLVGPKPANIGVPVISGDLRALGTLNGTLGTWTNEPEDYFFQWYVTDELIPIEGALLSSYKSALDLVGQKVRVGVSAGNLGGDTLAMSAPVTILPALVVPTIDNTFANSETVYINHPAFRGAFESIQDQIAAWEGQ